MLPTELSLVGVVRGQAPQSATPLRRSAPADPARRPHADRTRDGTARKLQEDWDALRPALEDSSREYNGHFLNTDTGEVAVLPIEFLDREEDAELVDPCRRPEPAR
ncbi:hypothetical protein H5T55_05395 [Candidatus Bipolaricaulota bacterium]|nr:hypothetical protein [Candidatus Bipolaricaulota bacterium]